MKLALAVLLALAACSKKSEEPARTKPVMVISEAEVQRSKDACKAYVDRVCACTAAAAKQPCQLAKALPEAIDLALGVAANPESDWPAAQRAQVNVRETVKECIEETAKLPALGCP